MPKARFKDMFHRCQALEPGSRAWQSYRKEKIPSLLAAACLGMDPHRSPRQAYREIIGELPSVSAWFAAHGRGGEEDAISTYEDIRRTVTCPTGVWDRADTPFLVCSPTREVFGEGILNLYMGKTPYDELPLQWRIRALIQLGITGKQFCDVCQCRPDMTIVWKVRPAGWHGLRQRLEIFHRRFIVTKKMPDKGEIKRWVSQKIVEGT